MAIVTLIPRLLENWQDPRERGLVTEIQHIPRVCPDFEKSRSNKAVEGYGTVCLTMLEFQLAFVLDESARVEQIDIEHFTQVCRARFVGSHHVSLEKDFLTLEVCGVVEMDIHLLLRIGSLKYLDMPHACQHIKQITILFCRLAVNTKRRNQKEQKKDDISHYVKVFR